MLVGQTIGKDDNAIYIEKELGSGAMGSVYRARYLKDDRVIALKIIAFGLADNDQARARFERESKILKQLKHPNITRLFGTGHTRKTPFFAMEYVDGESLDKLLARRGKLPWDDILNFGKQLTAALEHAHDKGIIHRDLKPSNIMIAKDGTVKLTDFGIAKDVDLTALTGANHTIGTAAYMSPEQCKGERNLTGKSDLYSLGVVFYELVTGQKPFVKESPIDLFMAHVNDPFERPSRLIANLPIWIDNLICQMMEKKPEMRPLNAATVGRALEEIQEKIAAHKSIGQEVANARIIDRVQMTSAPDAADREASRVIRSSAKRKKVKKKKVPIYRKLWFTICVIVLVFIGLAFGIYWAIQPPDPNIAFTAAMAAKDDETREKLLTDYVGLYKESKGKDWETAHDALFDLKAKKSDLAMWRRVQTNRLKAEPEYDEKAYDLIMKGYKQESEGDIKSAGETWKELADSWLGREKEGEIVWGWIGKRHQALLKDVEAFDKSLRNKREYAFTQEEDPKWENDDQQKAYDALRLELIGDFTRAKEKWKALGEDLTKDKSNDRRLYLILAAQHGKDLDLKATPKPEDREKFVKGLLAQALAWKDSDNLAALQKMRNLLKDIHDLYKTDAAPLAKLAQQADDALQEWWKAHPPGEKK